MEIRVCWYSLSERLETDEFNCLGGSSICFNSTREVLCGGLKIIECTAALVAWYGHGVMTCIAKTV